MTTSHEEIIAELRLRLHFLRDAKHLTLEGLAKKTGIDLTSLSRFETGARLPTIPQVLTLADVLGTDAGYLLSPPKRRSLSEVEGGSETKGAGHG